MLNIKTTNIIVASTILLLILSISYIPINNHIAESSTPVVITSLPYNITEPGIYVLSGNLTTSSNGINVMSDDVVIIGNGYTITGSGTGAGINMSEMWDPDLGLWVSWENVTIKNLTIKDFEYGIYANELWSDYYHFQGIVIDMVTIVGCDVGIYLEDINDPGGIIINRTTIQDSHSSGIYIYDVSDLYILNTMINGSMGEYDDYGMDLEDPDGVYIYNTTVMNTYYEGIYVYGYYDYGYSTVTIVNSKIVNTLDDGIELDSTYGVVILYSNISGNAFSGINISDTDYVWIYQDIITGNEEYGVYADTSDYLFINSSVISGNGYGGIYTDSSSNDVYIWGNQINYNDGYGVEAYSSSDLFVTLNTFGDNSYSPQAYDDAGAGVWVNNYWSDLVGSTYTFDYNSDPSPLEDPLPYLHVNNIIVPDNVTGGDVVDVLVNITNLGYGPASNKTISLYWSEPVAFQPVNYTWIPIDQFNAVNVSDGDVLEDYGNYTLWDADDGYFVYKLPWGFELYGNTYTYLSISSNGFVELLTGTEPVVYDEYEVHWIGIHRTGYDYISNYTYGAGVSAIFGFDGDLYAYYYVGVFNLGDKVVVVFNGTTYEDEEPDYPIQYQIILSRDGTITISLGSIDYTDLEGDGYTGLYVQPLGLELQAGFLLPQHTSWTVKTSLHQVDQANVSLAPNQTSTITLHWDTSTLPHLSPFTLWTGGAPTPWPTSPTPGPTINVRPPPPGPAVVGGKITTPHIDTPLLLLTLIIIPITTIILIKNKK